MLGKRQIPTLLRHILTPTLKYEMHAVQGRFTSLRQSDYLLPGQF